MFYTAIFAPISVLGVLAGYLWHRNRLPGSQEIEERCKQGREHLALRHFEKAEHVLQPLIEGGVKDPALFTLYAQALIGQKQASMALDFIEFYAIDLFPEELSLQREQGRALLELGRPGDALRALRRAQPILRTEEERLDLALALFGTSQIAEAWRTIQPFITHSCIGRLLSLAGDCLCHWKRDEEAIELYGRSRKLGWSSLGAVTNLAHCLRRQGKFLEARRLFRDVMTRDTSHVGATLGLGACLEGQGLHERALYVYQSGKAWDQGHPLLLARAGVCAAKTGQYAFAQASLEEALKRGVCSAELFSHLGFAQEALQKWEEAEKSYTKLVDLFPHHGAGYRALAWLFAMGFSHSLAPDQGVAMARRAVELERDNTSLELLCACQARAGDYEAAHAIQRQLSARTADQSQREKRQSALRKLERKQPLDPGHLRAFMVA